MSSSSLFNNNSLQQFSVPSRSEAEQKSISTEHFNYFVRWSFEVLRGLLLSAKTGEWNKIAEEDNTQQSFDKSSNELLLLRSAEGAKPPRTNGDTVYNKYCQNGYMSLLRPSAFKSYLDDNDDQQQQKHQSEEENEHQHDLTIVMFIGWRKPDLSGSSELWNVEDGLMDDLMKDSTRSIHYYCVLPINDGVNYINVVVGRPLKTDETPMSLMGDSNFHRRAVMNASPEAYDWVRIHAGKIQFQKYHLLEKQQLSALIRIERTLCVDFGKDMPPKVTPEMIAKLIEARRNYLMQQKDEVEEREEEGKAAAVTISPNTPFSSSFTEAHKAGSCPYARRGVKSRYVEKRNLVINL